MSDEQLDLDRTTEPPAFYTDEALARELQQIENRLADWAQAIPAMVRRVRALRTALLPDD